MSISNKDIKHPKLSYFGIEKDAIMRFYLYRKPNVIFRTLIRNICKFVPPWPSGLKRWNQTPVPVVRARFEPRCGRPHFAPTRSGVRACGRNRTDAREREWAEGTVSQSTGHVKRSDKILPYHWNCVIGVVGSGPAQQAMLSEGSDPANPPQANIRTKFIKKKIIQPTTISQRRRHSPCCW